MQYDLNTLSRILIDVAQQELMPRFNKIGHSFKADGSFVTEADLAAQAAIQQALKAQYPDIPFLGEEMPEAEQQALIENPGDGLWILDPLDGTSNYASGIPYFAVSLALLDRDGIRLGIVYAPSYDECFTAARGQGSYLNGRRLGDDLPGSPLKKGIGLVDYKRLPAELAGRLAQNAPYSSQRSFGSVALDWCWLAAGRCHVYLHGKQRIWDYGAGELIHREAGGHSTTLDGERLFQPTLQPRSAVGALDDTLFKQWTQWLQIPGHR